MGRIILVAVVATLIYLAFRRAPRGYDPDARGVALLHMCGGDSVRMERMISDEQRRSPGLSRAGAIDKALEAFRRNQA